MKFKNIQKMREKLKSVHELLDCPSYTVTGHPSIHPFDRGTIFEIIKMARNDLSTN